MELKYPFYKQNSHLSLVTITTANGDTEYRINCKRINGEWYVKNKDLEYIGGAWCLKKDLVFDYEIKALTPRNPNQIKGIVAFDEIGSAKFGTFTKNPYKNCLIESPEYGIMMCMDYNTIPPKFYAEDYSSGIYRDTRRLTSNQRSHLKDKKISINNVNNNYNIEDNRANFNKQIELYEGSNIPIDFDIRLASRYLKDITFGAELETINGTLPTHIQNKYGIIICKDGSLRNADGAYPPEYVTVPLTGAKGVQTLRNVSKEIALRSSIDIKCSYHLHIGNIKIDRLFIVSMFKLCTKIQDDVFAMFPYYKANPAGVKEKNYCKKLPKNILNTYQKGDFNTFINDTYTDIFSFLSGGIKCDDTYNRHTKRSPWPEGKWNIKTRYYWVNFVNLLFSSRNTIEFRIHTPTLNPDKIINWLFMCNAICKFAEKYPKRCITNKPVSFVDVLNYYASTSSTIYANKLSTNLIEYYQERCKMFVKDIKNNDPISAYELNEDSQFSGNALLLK